MQMRFMDTIGILKQRKCYDITSVNEDFLAVFVMFKS